MRDDDAGELEWEIIEAMMGEPTTAGTARWRDIHGIFYRLPSATARVMRGNLWIDPLGVVARQTDVLPPVGFQRIFRNGWVLTINDQAVTTVGEFAAVVEKLRDSMIRKKLGLPSLEDEVVSGISVAP